MAARTVQKDVRPIPCVIGVKADTARQAYELVGYLTTQRGYRVLQEAEIGQKRGVMMDDEYNIKVSDALGIDSMEKLKQEMLDVLSLGVEHIQPAYGRGKTK